MTRDRADGVVIALGRRRRRPRRARTAGRCRASSCASSIPTPTSRCPPDSEGEIVVRGSSLMRTYYKRERAECFDAEGFFHTGDCGRIDARGLAALRRAHQGRHQDRRRERRRRRDRGGAAAASRRQGRARRAGAASDPRRERRRLRRRRGDGAAAPPICRRTAARRWPATRCRATSSSIAEEELPTLGSGKVDRQRCAPAPRSWRPPPSDEERRESGAERGMRHAAYQEAPRSSFPIRSPSGRSPRRAGRAGAATSPSRRAGSRRASRRRARRGRSSIATRSSRGSPTRRRACRRGRSARGGGRTRTRGWRSRSG